MKYLSFLFILAALASCEKESNDPWEGRKDFFTCKVNGRDLKLNDFYDCASEKVFYYPRGTDQLPIGFFTMNGGGCKPYERAGIGITNLDPNVKIYFPIASDSVRFYYSPELFNTIDSAVSGQIQFSTIIPQQYDQDGKRIETAKVEGTFHFTVVDTAGKEWRITEGRFGFFNIQ